MVCELWRSANYLSRNAIVLRYRKALQNQRILRFAASQTASAYRIKALDDDGIALAQVTLSRLTEEITNMNARINEATISGLTRNDEQTSEAINQARYAMLNELPGLVFGFLTLAWIVTSLFSLV
jgi:hypothetical protein